MNTARDVIYTETVSVVDVSKRPRLQSSMRFCNRMRRHVLRGRVPGVHEDNFP